MLPGLVPIPPPSAAAEFGFKGAATGASSSAGTSFTGNLTIPAGTFALIVLAARGTDSVANPSAVSLNGQAATHIVTRASDNSGNMVYVSFWRVAATFAAGTVPFAATFNSGDDKAPRCVAALLYEGAGSGAAAIGATAGGSSGINDSALSQSITAQAATSHLVFAGGVGGNRSWAFHSSGGLTELLDVDAESGGVFAGFFIGYKTAGSTSAQSIGCTSDFPGALESVGQAVEVKAA